MFGRNKSCIPITLKKPLGLQSATRFRSIQGLVLYQHLTELSHRSFTWMFQRVHRHSHIHRSPGRSYNGSFYAVLCVVLAGASETQNKWEGRKVSLKSRQVTLSVLFLSPWDSSLYEAVWLSIMYLCIYDLDEDQYISDYIDKTEGRKDMEERRGKTRRESMLNWADLKHWLNTLDVEGAGGSTSFTYSTVKCLKQHTWESFIWAFINKKIWLSMNYKRLCFWGWSVGASTLGWPKHH